MNNSFSIQYFNETTCILNHSSFSRGMLLWKGGGLSERKVLVAYSLFNVKMWKSLLFVGMHPLLHLTPIWCIYIPLIERSFIPNLPKSKGNNLMSYFCWQQQLLCWYMLLLTAAWKNNSSYRYPIWFCEFPNDHSNYLLLHWSTD